MDTITTRIKTLVREWGVHPFDINNGHCEDFAEVIEMKVEGAQLEWDDEESHCYIVYGDRYYDAEEPYGVDSPDKLPLFHRQKDGSAYAEVEVSS